MDRKQKHSQEKTKLRSFNYKIASSCARCKHYFFTNQNIAGPMELQLQDGLSILIKHSHIFSFDSSDKTQISVTYKAVIMCNNNVHRSKKSRTTHFRKLPQPSRFRSTSHKTIYTARQWLRIFLLYRVTRD